MQSEQLYVVQSEGWRLFLFYRDKMSSLGNKIEQVKNHPLGVL